MRKAPQTMMNSLYMAILIIGACAVLPPAGVLVVRKFLHGKVAEGHNDVLVPLFLMAGTLYAVLLGFMVIAVWESYESARGNVADEAATLVALYRETNGMQTASGEKMRELIREYAEAVIHDEWTIQATTGKASNKARKAIGNLSRAFCNMDPKIKVLDAEINAVFLHTATQIVADRNRRTLQANESMPWVMWLGAIGGAVIVLTMSFFLFMERGWPHALMESAMGALIGTLLFIILVLNHPFVGPLAISSEPFETTLQTLDAVDQGN